MGSYRSLAGALKWMQYGNLTLRKCVNEFASDAHNPVVVSVSYCCSECA